MQPPIFEVIDGIEDPADRRLTTAEKVGAMLEGEASESDDEDLEDIIDRITGEAVRHCRLARGLAGEVPTFGLETVRATWLIESEARGHTLILPWRAPITAISSVVEDDETLEEGTDYRRLGGGMLMRLSEDAPVNWSRGKIVVTYETGWALPDDVPPEIEGRVIEQVKMEWLGRDRDPALRSEATQDVGSASYSVDGGTSIGDSGLLKALKTALGPFRNPAPS